MKPYYDHDGITIYQGDCLEVMPALHSIDAVVTDPPFAFKGGSSNGRIATTDEQFFLHWWKDVVDKLTMCLKDEGCGFVWCDWRTAQSISKGFEPRGQSYDFWHVSSMLYHHREMPGMGNPFRSSVDMIAYVRGPKHKVDRTRIPANTLNFLSQYWYYGKHEFHPTEKSPAIARQLIEWSSTEGMTILDPFMGSGTSLLAAKQCGRLAIGIEIEERYCEVAVARLAQRVMQL